MLSDLTTVTISDSDSTLSNTSQKDFDQAEHVAIFKDKRQTPAHAPGAKVTEELAKLIKSQPSRQMVLHTEPAEPTAGGSGVPGNNPVTPTVEEEENLEQKEDSRDGKTGCKDDDETSDNNQGSGSDTDLDSEAEREKNKQQLIPPENALSEHSSDESLTPAERERLAREE